MGSSSPPRPPRPRPLLLQRRPPVMAPNIIPLQGGISSSPFPRRGSFSVDPPDSSPVRSPLSLPANVKRPRGCTACSRLLHLSLLVPFPPLQQWCLLFPCSFPRRRCRHPNGWSMRCLFPANHPPSPWCTSGPIYAPSPRLPIPLPPCPTFSLLLSIY